MTAAARASTTDAIEVTALVAVDPATAFAVFTGELALWWRREPRFRAGGAPGAMRLEPGVGGRLLEAWPEREVELARVIAWEPPARLVLAWRGARAGDAIDDAAGAGAGASAGEVRTEVDVRFVAEGAATRVTIVHRGWDRVAAADPQRLGLDAFAFASAMGLWWAELLGAAARRARSR